MRKILLFIILLSNIKSEEIAEDLATQNIKKINQEIKIYKNKKEIRKARKLNTTIKQEVIGINNIVVNENKYIKSLKINNIIYMNENYPKVLILKNKDILEATKTSKNLSIRQINNILHINVKQNFIHDNITVKYIKNQKIAIVNFEVIKYQQNKSNKLNLTNIYTDKEIINEKMILDKYLEINEKMPKHNSYIKINNIKYLFIKDSINGYININGSLLRIKVINND